MIEPKKDQNVESVLDHGQIKEIMDLLGCPIQDAKICLEICTEYLNRKGQAYKYRTWQDRYPKIAKIVCG